MLIRCLQPCCWQAHRGTLDETHLAAAARCPSTSLHKLRDSPLSRSRSVGSGVSVAGAKTSGMAAVPVQLREVFACYSYLWSSILDTGRIELDINDGERTVSEVIRITLPVTNMGFHATLDLKMTMGAE
jgi:hypothetical protein